MRRSPARADALDGGTPLVGATGCSGDQQLLALYRQLGYQGGACDEHLPSALSRAGARRLPSVLAIWMVVRDGRARARVTPRRRCAGRSSRPAVSSIGGCGSALWLLLLGIALLVAGWSTGAPSAWTLLVNLGLGYCVQVVAVVESMLLARGVPSSIIALTFVFVFAMAAPVFSRRGQWAG
jgi:hypothetical protein